MEQKEWVMMKRVVLALALLINCIGSSAAWAGSWGSPAEKFFNKI